MEEIRRKSSLTVPSSLPLPPLPSSNQPHQIQRHLSLTEAERTYIFTPTNASSTETQTLRLGSGHSRSVSHGGGAISSAPRIPLKSAMKGGHQRALSQGQIQDVPPTRSGHSRVGSRTEFILPPTHKEPDETRESSTKTISARGHSRQASRSESIYTLRRQDLPPWWKRFLFCRSSKFEEHGLRQVVPNHTIPAKTTKKDHPNGKYVGNKIRTTKYTVLTFLPKNLIEQFHRVANLYFVAIQILNWMPQLTVFGKEIAMIPLLFVLGVTAIKDLFEDRRRYASDKRINNSTCRVYHGESKKYVKMRWQDVSVGDIVHLSNNEIVPADILLLKSSEPQGVCYIDTCDLDGETNLKRRQCVRGFDEKQANFAPSEFVSKLEIDPPTTKIYRFHGAMVHPSGERVPVSSDNLLLRESRLKNTSYVEGVVVYAGHETKAMLNNSGPRYKRSYLEQKMNIDVIWCVIILLLLCFAGAFGCNYWLKKFQNKDAPYLTQYDVHNPLQESVIMFLRLIIILQILIPLALYVSIEFCKVLQVFAIHNSLELYDPHTDKKTECRAMNITENLGQIQYIFSDKTGTLTENRMVFRRCTVAGIDYNHAQSEEEKTSLPNSPLPPVIPNPNLQTDLTHCDTNGQPSVHAQRCREFLTVLALCNTVVVSESPHVDNMNASGFIEGNADESGVTQVKPSDPLMTDHYLRLSESRSVTPSPPLPTTSLKMHHVPSLSPISSSAESSPESDSPPMRIKAITPTGRVRSIIDSVSKLPIASQILASSKSVKKFQITTKQKLMQTTKQRPREKPITTNQYEAESPDELALVNAAYAYGFILENRNPNTVLINDPIEGNVEYELLKVLPFDSNRKCMSIVTRRINVGVGQRQEVILFTKGADSTILPALAPCPLDSEEYILRERTQQQLDLYARQGLRVLLIAKRNLDPVEFSEWYSKHQECEMSTESREKKVRESFALLERNLTLIGATGIEDRLQENVPETIANLLAAGIVVWVLTGDKTETAINIAFSAKLFHSQMEILKLTARSRDAAENCIKFYMDEIEKQLIEAGDDDLKSQKKRALVVDGKTLTFILDLKSNLTVPFLELTRYCSSVLCCRSTPLQKAFLVKVVKEELNMSTLAIGDGANDVSMLQMADVGIGICGQEGMQAVMASDFAIAKFKILEKLLLIHGHLNYDRLAKLIIYFFYKNATFVFVLFWFQLYCGFSGSVMMEQMYVMIYNFMFSAAPPLAIGAFEKRLHEDILSKNPRLYRYGRLGKGYRNQFWLVMLDSIWQSSVIFFVAVNAFRSSDIGIWELGATIVSSCLITMLSHFAIETRTWTYLQVAAIGISLASFYIFAFIFNSVCGTCMNLPNTARTIHDTMSNPIYYLVLILTPVLALLPRLFIRAVKNTMRPSDDIVVQVDIQKEKRRELRTIRTKL